MRVLLDARTVGREFSGVGNYVLELVQAFHRLDEDVRFDLLTMRETRLAEIDLDDRFVLHRAPFSHESHPLGDIWEHFVLPRIASRLRADVLHGPAFLIPTRPTKARKIVTIHDLVAFTHPETIPKKYALYMRWLIRRAASHASRIITVSRSVRDDVVRVLGTSRDRVDAIHSGVSPRFHPCDPAEIDRVRQRYALPKQYLLFVGNLEPRKNLSGLLRAFRQVMRQEPELTLVIAGKIAWLSGGLLRELESDDLADCVLTTGYVEPDDLPALYSGARAFVFPTFWEGFGLPVLEAMACGTPVVASAISSIPEVVGSAAVLVDPKDPWSIAAGVLEALEPRRSERLRAQGLEHVRDFSWETTARETLATFRRASEGPT